MYSLTKKQLKTTLSLEILPKLLKILDIKSNGIFIYIKNIKSGKKFDLIDFWFGCIIRYVLRHKIQKTVAENGNSERKKFNKKIKRKIVK